MLHCQWKAQLELSQRTVQPQTHCSLTSPGTVSSVGTYLCIFVQGLKMHCSKCIWTWSCNESSGNYVSCFSFWQFYFQYAFSLKPSSNITACELSLNSSQKILCPLYSVPCISPSCWVSGYIFACVSSLKAKLKSLYLCLPAGNFI